MNHSVVNTTLSSCSNGFPLNPANVSSGYYTALVVKTAINVFACPFTILLNILVMIAVKTKRQLRTKSNIALACLATTDFIVGLVLQPLQIATFGLVLQGGETPNLLCTLVDVTRTVSVTCTLASVYHLFVMSGERYLAIKHCFKYEDGLVTEARIMIASGLSWFGAVTILSIESIFERNGPFGVSVLKSFVALFVIIPVMFYFNIDVYKEVRRSEKQIIANQVSLEAKAKLLKDKKAFYTTIIVIFTIFLCYIPVNLATVILVVTKDRIPANTGYIVLTLSTSLPVLNSLFNPLIYVVRIRYFRVAFIHLLFRKTLAQAEELENRILGARRIGVGATTEQQQNRVVREEVEDVQQANEAFNIGHATTEREQTQVEH